MALNNLFNKDRITPSNVSKAREEENCWSLTVNIAPGLMEADEIKSKIKGILCLAIIGAFVFSSILVSSLTSANESASITLNPPSIDGQSAGVGGTFTVTANVSSPYNVWGWSIGLSWNPSVLQMVNFSEGSFLSSAGQTSLTAAPIDNNNGVIQNINDVLTSQSSISGSGDLVSFTFQIVGYGSTQINLINVELLGPAVSSSDPNPQIPTTVTGAVFSNEAATTSVVSPAASLSDAAFSAVQSGSTSTSSIQLGPSPDPIGSTVQVDVRIDGVTTGFWGWTISTLSWNPAVLNITKVAQGPFLSDNSGSDPAAFVGNSKSLWNYTGGYIMGGISEAIQAADISTDSSGVVATLTFVVVGYGTSPITIAGGNVRASSSDHGGTAITCNNATITVLSNNPSSTPTPSPTSTPNPTVHGPTASFAPQNGTLYTVGTAMLLDASSSTPGFDAVTCPITGYAWLVEYQNSTLFGSFSGKTVTFTVPNPASLKITLIVTAPDLNSPGNPNYLSTSTTTAWIQIVTASQQAAKIDVFTDKGGANQNGNGGVYGPQELVKICAQVTYNGAPVVNNEVSFAVLSPNGTICSITSDLTNQTGYAEWQFRLPGPDSNSQSTFGNWSIIASVGVSQIVVSDTVQFTFNYFVNVNGIQLPASVQRSQSISINVTVQSIASTPAILSVTLCDEQQVPIAFANSTLNPATGPVTITLNVTIPSWAFVGTATVYVDLLTSPPTAGGVPLCPERTANFQVLA